MCKYIRSRAVIIILCECTVHKIKIPEKSSRWGRVKRRERRSRRDLNLNRANAVESGVKEQQDQKSPLLPLGPSVTWPKGASYSYANPSD